MHIVLDSVAGGLLDEEFKSSKLYIFSFNLFRVPAAVAVAATHCWLLHVTACIWLARLQLDAFLRRCG